MSKPGVRRIIDLKSGEENVTVVARVLQVNEPRVVETRRGPRTLSEAVIGDASGRIKLTLWGKHAGTLQQGQVVKISRAWTSSFKGEVQLNVGSRSVVEVVDESMAPEEDEIPSRVPRASRSPGKRSRFYQRR